MTTDTIDQLDPVSLHALLIASKPAAKVRGKLDVGTHLIDCMVWVRGELTVSGDQTVSVKKNLSTEQLLASVLAATTPATAKRIVEKVVQSGANQTPPEKDSLVAELAAKLLTRTATESLVTRRGSVSGKITATEV